jgi:hypothetical protein
MIAVELTSPELSPRRPPGHSTAEIARDNEHSRLSSADAPATVAAQFRPLDPGIVNQTIPAFFIGRNREGFWVARDAKGQIGGIFLLEKSALSFARRNSGRGCATIFPSGRIELDLDNRGNPLVVPLGWLRRVAVRCRQRAVALIRDMMEAMQRSS